MANLDITLLKKHVRADDFADDDDYLEHLLCAAYEYVAKASNRSCSELLDLGGGFMPPTLQHAALLIAGHWYNQREAVSSVQMQEVPYTLQAMIKPYRKLADDATRTTDTEG